MKKIILIIASDALRDSAIQSLSQALGFERLPTLLVKSVLGKLLPQFIENEQVEGLLSFDKGQVDALFEAMANSVAQTSVIIIGGICHTAESLDLFAAKCPGCEVEILLEEGFWGVNSAQFRGYLVHTFDGSSLSTVVHSVIAPAAPAAA